MERSIRLRCKNRLEFGSSKLYVLEFFKMREQLSHWVGCFFTIKKLICETTVSSFLLNNHCLNVKNKKKTWDGGSFNIYQEYKLISSTKSQ